ncbi:Retrovirus-related Pol polyprotein from transposon TNT 1-94 [Vitis vinifera]|uniref:Retrovirus-related Pol polyprotein from transposon TNT 1-94 n=1 Tax=Vitis vinifera TaxID=29760 RepID=A0A438HU60_VITVI|nr:Retrovirus-related Pol polyprotein from transposon TNT 1-94 [Vitis vinifera]
MSVGINIEHPVAHTHTQNGLAESFIKRLQLIARPLLMKTKLPTSAWGHAIMHAAALVRIRPITYHEYSPSQLVLEKQPNISHLRIFGCAVYVPIAPTQRTKMGSQRRLGVYVGREKSIPEERREISWKTSTMTHLDPLTKSHIPAANTPARIDVPVGQLTNESKIRLKRGRPVGSKDVTPRKRRTQEKLGTLEEAIKMTDQFKIDKSIALEEAQIMQKAPEEVYIEQEAPEEAHIEQETLKIHILNEKPLKRHRYLKIVRSQNDEDPEPRNVEEYRHRNDWPKWKEAIQAELNSLTKQEVFGPVVQTPEDVKPVGYKWVFVRKRNENNEIIRYKARLVAQGFSQRPGIDYEETYSPVMDAITFRFLISLAVSEGLDMRLMDVITAYLYGSMDNDIYMKIPEGFKLPDANNTKPHSMYSIKLQRSLYGLKQSGLMWYNRLSEYLLKEGYVNNPICPCIFIKKSETGFAIIAVYVDDLNLVGTLEELTRTTNYLKKEFEMKDLGKTKFCLGLQIEHFPNGVLVHQSTYIKKVLKRFYMDKAHLLIPYLSAIGALMYLANCTRPDIAFSINLLARYNSAPTRRHWNGIKHILRYLRGTTDMGLFYSRESKQQLLGYADAGYLSDPHKGRSQTGYVFNCNGTAISSRSVKQTMVATSSNHSEILAIHEASRECIWLRSMIQHIRESCGLSSIKGGPTTLFEDNAACIAQITGGYIKGDRTKHISPKFFYTHELQKSGEIDVQQIHSSDNLADLFTKSLPTSTFKKLIHRIGMRQLKDINMRGSMLVKGC